MKFVTAAVAAALMASPVSAFTGSSSCRRQQLADTRLFLEPNALMDYMTKAHEEKLKAVKDAEEKKESEIQGLKSEIKQLKSAPGALATAASPSLSNGDMTNAELATKLLQYQQMMAKYIVDAQAQKALAVKAAEDALKAKYEAKMNLLSAADSSSITVVEVGTTDTKLYDQRSATVAAAAAAGKSRWGDMEAQKAVNVGVNVAANGIKVSSISSVPAAAPATSSSSASTANFDQRNAMIAAAGKAGKSRWGEMEVAKATKMSVSLPSGSTAASPAVPVVSVPVPPEVAEADHGLRNDGGVGGPSLAERINLGSALAGGAPALVSGTVGPSSSTSLYEKRNNMIAAAGKAGKSRWGEMEVSKAQGVATALPAASSSAFPIPAAVAEADHGLRNDGGVGGPSLSDRVNLGATLLEGAPALVSGTVGPSSTSLYEKRNGMIAAAGKAGKSRWGEMEVSKAQKMATALPAASSSSAFPIPAAVAEADHGLRNDGGVGGPSLAQRVNMGAVMLG